MIRTMSRFIIALVTALLIACLVASIWLGIDLAGEIREVGLKGVVEQVWYGKDNVPQDALKEMKKVE